MQETAERLSGAAQRALALAARHVNASLPHPAADTDLLEWIRSGVAPNGRAELLRAFIDETDTATLQDLVLSEAVTYRQLARIADQFLPGTHGTRAWLDDRRAL